MAPTSLGRRALPRSAAALTIGLVVLAGCSDGSSEQPPPSATDSATGAAPGLGNGAIYRIEWTGGQWQYERHPIDAGGSLGASEGPVALGGTESETVYLVDALGSTVATAPLTDYWSTRIDVRNASDGTLISSVEAPGWCAGEGLVHNPCLLLDADSLVRTSELGAEAEGSVTISSLRTAETEATWGPFEGLKNTVAGGQPGEVILVLADELMDSEGAPVSSAGTIVRLNASTGQTTQIGRYPANWDAICSIGPDSVLGSDLADTRALSVVGTSTVPEVELSEDDTPIGCSADGTVLYVEQLIFGENEDGSDTQTAVESISLVDGTRTRQLTVPATGLFTVTR